MVFRKGDYVVSILPAHAIFYRVTDATRDKSEGDLEGIVTNDDTEKFIKVFSLKTGNVSDYSAIYFKKVEVPKEHLKEYLLYVRNNILVKASDHIENIVVQKECHGEQVYVNPIMDEFRKNNCLCLNCNLMTGIRDTNCDIANQLYQVAVENNMAMAITRCKKYVYKIGILNGTSEDAMKKVETTQETSQRMRTIKPE